MEPSAKKQRLESTELQQTTNSKQQTANYLMQLNDDCILKIFEWLELDVLCVVGETCKKLQQLVVDFFQRKFQNKILNELRVQVSLDGQILLSPNEEYVKHFTKYMKNVTIRGGYQKRPLDVVNFMRNNCSSYIPEISFEDLKLNQWHGVLIIDWLKNVEKVTFFGCENVNHILKYCGKVKYLKVDKYCKDVKWLGEKYPTLEYLQYDLVPSNMLFTFLRINPNVKSLLWEFDGLYRKVTPQIIHNLSFIDLEELMLTLNDFSDLVRIVSQLKVLCEGSRFKRLQLCFNSMRYARANFDQLKCLKGLEGLHILEMDYQMLPSNVLLEHLKVLHLSYILNHRTSVIDELPKNLPNLEQLYLMELGVDLEAFITPFVRNSAKLSKIVTRDFKLPDRSEITNFRLTKRFNDEREQLLNACKLTIIIGKDEYDANFDLTSSKCLLVQIRQVEFQRKRVDFAKPYLEDFEF